MISLGLSTADLRLFNQSLITAYDLRVIVQVLDLNHRYVSDLSSMLVDGQVNLSYWDKITSTATLTLSDPDSQIGFDTQSPADGALYADRMLRIVYSVYSELLPKWVDVPIFCGPVTMVARDDALLSVEAQGKESLYLPPTQAWTARTYPKTTKLTATIRDVVALKGGETRLDMPEWGTTLQRDYSLVPEHPIWDFVLWIVGSKLYRQVFYDGRGVLRLRATQLTPSFTFTESHLTSVPKITYDMSMIRNTVRVKGATPEGKAQITATRWLPASDPASSTALARNGIRRNFVEVIEDSNIATQAAADALAQSTLDWLTIGNFGFDFDSVPIPHLEPGDLFRLSTRDVSLNLRADKFSIPLKPQDGSAQSNGTHRRISSNRTRIRRR
jgi:hypothetical protein